MDSSCLQIVGRAYDAFREAVAVTPGITLRGGDQLDSYNTPEPFDPELDVIDDAYLEAYAFGGVPHLDPASWCHYLPPLIEYALRNIAGTDSMAVDALLGSLRPPDRDPPRLAALSSIQEEVIVATLDRLAFADDSAYAEFAQQVLEEWWVPGAIYRPARPLD